MNGKRKKLKTEDKYIEKKKYPAFKISFFLIIKKNTMNFFSYYVSIA